MESETVIQRYMNLSKFIYLLQNSTLFLPKMSIFDDQLEGGLTAIDYLGNSDELDIFELAMASLPVCGESAEKRETRLNSNKLVQQEIDNKKFITPFGEYLKSDVQTIFPKCREHLYVSCWHRSHFECSAMWQLYGAEKNSVCIFTSVEKLEQLVIPNELFDNLKFKDVNYIDHAKAKFGSNCLEPFISKSLSFSFEKELRIVVFDSKINLDNVGVNEVSGVNIGIRSLQELIDKVIVSPSSDSWFKSCVENLCDRYGLKIDVEMSSLKRKPINNFFDALQNVMPR